jgi:hypothetical protein
MNSGGNIKESAPADSFIIADETEYLSRKLY